MLQVKVAMSNLTPPLAPLSPLRLLLPLPPPLLLPPYLPLRLPVVGRLLLPLPPAPLPAPLPADLHRANPPEVFRLPLPPEEDRLVPVFLRETPVTKNIKELKKYMKIAIFDKVFIWRVTIKSKYITCSGIVKTSTGTVPSSGSTLKHGKKSLLGLDQLSA
jgi:hypothetical protein